MTIIAPAFCQMVRGMSLACSLDSSTIPSSTSAHAFIAGWVIRQIPLISQPDIKCEQYKMMKAYNLARLFPLDFTQIV